MHPTQHAPTPPTTTPAGTRSWAAHKRRNIITHIGRSTTTQTMSAEGSKQQAAASAARAASGASGGGWGAPTPASAPAPAPAPATDDNDDWDRDTVSPASCPAANVVQDAPAPTAPPKAWNAATPTLLARPSPNGAAAARRDEDNDEWFAPRPVTNRQIWDTA